MEMATGHYLNVFSTNTERDIFVIFNEPNPEPTLEEIDTIYRLVQTICETVSEDDLPHKLVEQIEGASLECVKFGVQIIVC